MFFSMISCLVMSLYVLSILVGVMTSASPHQGERFDYRNTHSWGYSYPNCNGQRQSPIDLSSAVLQYIRDASPLLWKGYSNLPQTMILTNNGHTLQVSGVWPKNKIPSISNGPLENEYIFEQFHFHWGPDDSIGSEHTVNGTRFPMEIHFVHWNKKYGSFKNALDYADGLSVIALLFSINTMDCYTAPMNMLFDHVKEVRKIHSEVYIPPFPLTIFNAVDHTRSFVTYTGSLTTPPCAQIVQWIILNSISTVSNIQMQALRSVELDHNDRLNFRPIQSRNGRIISLHIPHRT